MNKKRLTIARVARGSYSPRAFRPKEGIALERGCRLAVWGFSHFCVDFACFFMLFHTVKPGLGDLTEVSLAFLIYNTAAFGLQPLAGYFCDSHPSFPAGLLGCLMTAAGVLLPLPWAALGICALGNALFHVGGGIACLRSAWGRLSDNGWYVSTGALGVAFGTLAGRHMDGPLTAALLLMASCGGIILYGKGTGNGACRYRTASGLSYGAVLALALFSVAIRSFAGLQIPMTWKTTEVLALVPGTASFLGKSAGGVLADRFGAKRVGVLSLAASLPLLLAGNDNAALSAMGILLFNITMPITLCAVAAKLPENPGFAFGLCSLALLVGNIPTFFLPFRLGPAAFVLLVVLSAASIACCTKNENQCS